MKAKIFKVLALLPLALQSASIPADQPQDQPISAIVGKQSLCLTPKFKGGDGYLYAGYCDNTAQRGRYDLFGRISFNVGGNSLCLQAPANVTDPQSIRQSAWDYVRFRPCVINDKNQRWRIKDGRIYTYLGDLELKSYDYYAYVGGASDSGDRIRLSDSMKNWINTAAAPSTLSLRTTVGWISEPFEGFSFYSLYNDASTNSELKWLYYNPSNGHIAEYSPGSGTLNCLSSPGLENAQQWDWAKWSPCTDDVARVANRHNAWYLSEMIDNEAELKDYNGNSLRLDRYGTHWGVPYVASPGYLDIDTAHSPTSRFIFTRDVEDFIKFENANLSLSLPSCEEKSHTEHRIVKRDLPSNFVLNDAWARRLYDIASTVDLNIRPAPRAGVCGTCMIHSFEMILELMGLHDESPLESGGFLFDTQFGTSPFTSLASRFPALNERLSRTRAMSAGFTRFETTDRFMNRAEQIVLAVSQIAMPNISLRPTRMVRSDEIYQLSQSVLNSPDGSLWLAVMYRSRPDGTGTVGHVQPVLSTRDGVVIIPTNTQMGLDNFRQNLQPLQSSDDMIRAFTLGGARRLELLQFYRVSVSTLTPLSVTISTQNCSASGSGSGYGNKRPLSPTELNQCESKKRCFE